MTNVAIILSILSILFTMITAIFAFLAYAKVVGMEKSTHQIQWMPVEDTKNTGEDLTKNMYKAFGFEDEDQDSVIP